jgi:hypothetical protein
MGAERQVTPFSVENDGEQADLQVHPAFPGTSAGAKGWVASTFFRWLEYVVDKSNLDTSCLTACIASRTVTAQTLSSMESVVKS